jgi:peptidoglycan/xylan/chitin deacetylase (PgdA/CDA1 family)
MSKVPDIAMIESPIPWPGGARCAVSFTFDIDSDSFLHLEYGPRAPDMVATTSWLRYDEVAVPRILRIYKAFGLRQTFFFPAWCMEAYPQLVDLILAGGHEIAHHGYLHEHPNRLSRDDEALWLDRASDTIKRMTGQAPRGYRAPVYDFSRHTADLLAERGFLYDATLMADDIPYVLASSSGDVIELPSHWALDDWPQFAHNIELQYMMSIRSPSEGFAIYQSEFEAAYRHGGLFVGGWHPWLTARLARADRLAEFIAGILDRGDVWIASMEEIARHVRNMQSNGHNLRRVKMPYYSVPLHSDDIPRQLNARPD